jgi:hypothetical protein
MPYECAGRRFQAYDVTPKLNYATVALKWTQPYTVIYLKILFRFQTTCYFLRLSLGGNHLREVFCPARHMRFGQAGYRLFLNKILNF